MDELTITIEPPITEYCRECDYEDSYSFYSHHHKCPKCGEACINSGARPPKDRAIRVSSNHGSYDFAHPSEKQWNYIFYNLPDGKSSSFTVDEELDTSDPIELAVELKEIFDRYILSSSKKKIDDLLAVIDTESFRERQDELMMAEKRTELEREIFKLNYASWR